MSQLKKSKGMIKSTNEYIDRLFESTSKLQVIRVDLGYSMEHAREASLDDLNADLKHMLNNKRTKPSIFGHEVGYIVKREYTQSKGPHLHCFFMYDGQKVSKDAYKGDQIGEYWNREITGGKGVYHNCNRDKAKYSKCGLGMINHSDEVARDVLKNQVLGYLCKPEQSIDPIKQSGSERSFTRGIAPIRKSRAGRPRRNDLDD